MQLGNKWREDWTPTNDAPGECAVAKVGENIER